MNRDQIEKTKECYDEIERYESLIRIITKTEKYDFSIEIGKGRSFRHVSGLLQWDDLQLMLLESAKQKLQYWQDELKKNNP